VQADDALRAKGGTILAVSVDSPEESLAVVEDEELPFPILSDAQRTVIHAYGLAHEDAGPGGETIAVPAQILVRPDGSIAWRHVASRITDRATPEQTLAAIARL
jgi:peroxiredoxin